MAMISALPENLQALFAPRPPLDYIPVPERKQRAPYSGFADCMTLFEDPKSVELTEDDKLRVENREQKKERIDKARKLKQDIAIEEQKQKWNPKQEHAGDPFHTLFVARLNYETTEETLRKEFEYYGPVKSISIIKNKKTGKSRGYAFIEYERERDMKSAYKKADGIRIDGYRILVDLERGRTVSSFLPRRLGGGLGNSRRPKLPKWLLPKPAPAPFRRGPPRYRSEGRRDDRGSYRGPPRNSRDRSHDRGRDRMDRGGDRGRFDRGGRDHRMDRGGDRGAPRFDDRGPPRGDRMDRGGDRGDRNFGRRNGEDRYRDDRRRDRHY